VEKELKGATRSCGYEDHEWISTATLFVVFQPNRARSFSSQNDSMVGFGLPQGDYLRA
jgi:hypothetical protein